MTFPSRPVLIVNNDPVLPKDQLESLWREACWVFLHACFNGAGKNRLDKLANAMLRAREAMVAR